MKGRVAMLTFGIGKLTGGGGAERFFADFFDYYSEHSNTEFRLFWLIDRQSVNNLQNVGKLKKSEYVYFLRLFSNRMKYFLENTQLLLFIIFRRITVVHIPLYNYHYLPFLRFLGKLPHIWRPAITINIVDCQLPFCYVDQNLPRHKDVVSIYSDLFSNVPVDGYIAWNKSFVEFAENSGFVKGAPVLYSISSRFCDTTSFFPERKENIVVFASRLVIFKNVDWFIKAVSMLKQRIPGRIEGWRFLICGDGPMKASAVELVQKLSLSEVINFIVEPKMERVLNKSRCFVSCQDFDNFPSLSMAEAMAAGNVIVSRNVGQTDLFVKDNVNGFLATDDSPEGIAVALERFFLEIDRADELGQNGIRIMNEIHTPTNFVPQIDQFWTRALSKQNS